MKQTVTRIISFMLCIVMLAGFMQSQFFKVSADTASELKNDIAQLQKESEKLEAEIARLKREKKDQATILSAVQKKVANIQSQILRCNKEIDSINAKIAQNNAQIAAKNKEMEDTKLEFKKRIRAIYMSNTGSNVQILLGADDFAEFLQLSKLTESISARDKLLMEKIVDAIKLLNEIKAENEKLLESQQSVKEAALQAQKELEKEEAAAQSIYNEIAGAQSSAEKDNKQIEATIKEKTAYLNQLLYGNSGQSFINSNVGFLWPVPSCQNITSYYGPRWGTTHKGIDISNGSIFGKPIIAITDGYVYRTYNSCPHKDRGSRCRCGSGWGNHVAIDHGSINGANIKAMYAHMNTIAVSNGQFVKKGQTIGYVGTTGDSTGYHLHFGIMKNNAWVNPMNYYSKVK